MSFESISHGGRQSRKKLIAPLKALDDSVTVLVLLDNPTVLKRPTTFISESLLHLRLAGEMLSTYHQNADMTDYFFYMNTKAEEQSFCSEAYIL